MSNRLKNKKVAILAEDRYEELELWYPLLRLKEAGLMTVVIGTGRASVFTGKYGYPIKPDITISQAKPTDFNAVVIPGGYAPDFLRRSSEVLDFVRKVWEGGGVVAGICHAGWVLISAGIVKGKKVTGFFSIKDDLINAGAEYRDAPVVVDGRLVTSRGPQDLPYFVREIIRLLELQE